MGGAATIDLEWVQVHPTGLVKPDDADAKIKFLAAEALRGVGGLVFDKEGKRFANELGRRDYVTGEMWKNKPPFRLCLNKAASDEIIWHCKHYTGRGVMKFYESGAALAKDMGIDVQVLIDEHDQHYQAAKKTEKDPDGGSWPAYPSGKSWDARRVQLAAVRSSTTTSFKAPRLPQNLSMLPSSRQQSTTAWEAWRLMRGRVFTAQIRRSSQACMPQVKWLEASTATIVLVETPCLTVWSLAASQQKIAHHTCLARM